MFGRHTRNVHCWVLFPETSIVPSCDFIFLALGQTKLWQPPAALIFILWLQIYRGLRPQRTVTTSGRESTFWEIIWPPKLHLSEPKVMELVQLFYGHHNLDLLNKLVSQWHLLYSNTSFNGELWWFSYKMRIYYLSTVLNFNLYMCMKTHFND